MTDRQLRELGYKVNRILTEPAVFTPEAIALRKGLIERADRALKVLAKWSLK